MRPTLTLLAIALALALAACGDDDDSGPTSTTATTATAPTDDLIEEVEASGKFKRMALRANDRTVEASLIEDCLSSDLASTGSARFASYRAAAPPCRPIARVGVLPKLRIRPGDTLEIHTGTQADGAYVTFIEFGDPASRHVSVNAEREDDTLQVWRAKVPAKLKVLDRIDVSVGPLRTDSGSVTFAVRAER